MKTLIKLFIYLLIFSFIGVFIFSFYGGYIIKQAVEVTGPEMTGTSVVVNEISLLPHKGILEINEMKIGNPDGFENTDSFVLNNLRFNINVGSVFKDVIHIKELKISGVEINWIDNKTGINILEIEKKIRKFSEQLKTKIIEKSEKTEKTERPTITEKTEKKNEEINYTTKKIIIDKFVFEKSKIKITSNLFNLKNKEIKLPDFELKDIGKNQNGEYIFEIIHQLYKQIFAKVKEKLKDSSSLSEKLKNGLEKQLHKLKSSDLDKLKNNKHINKLKNFFKKI